MRTNSGNVSRDLAENQQRGLVLDNAATRLNTVGNDTAKGKSSNGKTVGKKLGKDVAKELAKTALKVLEERAWRRYFRLEALQRLHYPLLVQARAHYWHTQDELTAFSEFRAKMLRGVDLKAGFKIIYSQPFERAQSLRIDVKANSGLWPPVNLMEQSMSDV